MTVREVWYGSVGPFLYDDEDLYDDGEPFEAIHGFGTANSQDLEDTMQDHLDAFDPHPQYQMKSGVFAESERQRGRGVEIDQRHNPRYANIENR